MIGVLTELLSVKLCLIPDCFRPVLVLNKVLLGHQNPYLHILQVLDLGFFICYALICNRVVLVTPV